MNRENALEIGIIAKTRGVSGEVILELKDASVKQNIKESVHLEIDGLLVPFFILSQQSVSTNRLRIILDWVDTEDKAHKIVNCKAFIPSSVITDSLETELSPTLLEGFEAIDQEKGSIGHVSQFVENDKNPLLIIKHGRSDIIIPFQPDLIQEIDPEKKKIYINAPIGLIDIYL